MKVQVRLFSLLRERAGVKEAPLELPPGATVGQALQALAQRMPGLRDTLEREPRLVLVSVNREYAAHQTPLRDGDEVALFPPVSGGADPAVGLLLLSGGFDSPVAGQLTQTHGHVLDAVHFSMEPFTDDASSRKATQLAAHLGLRRLTIVPLGPVLSDVARLCDPRCYFVLQKRLMVRVAQRLAPESGATFLVTGENLGQVSSQTLPNLAAIDAVATLPIVRPLLGWDKHEIISRARSIGTYETSKGPEVCDVLGPKHPSTAVGIDRVLREEAKLDVESLVSRALSAAITLDPGRGYEPPASGGPAFPACL